MRRRHAPRQREVHGRDVKVNDVEVVGALRDLLDHQHVRGKRIGAAHQTLRLRTRRDQGRRRARVAAGEQRDCVSLPHELVGQNGQQLAPSRRRALAERFHSAVQLVQFSVSQVGQTHERLH